MDPKLEALVRHPVSEREAAERGLELRGLGPEATWRLIDSLCMAVAETLSTRADRQAVLSEQDPPHSSYGAVMRKLSAGYRYSPQ